MSGNKLLESLKIKECDRFPSRVSGHCNWDSIRLIKSHLTQKQLELFKATCFGHFLDVSDMVLSGQFCHHILLRECHVKNADDNASSLWYHVGNGLIRFSPVEFYLVSGLAFAENFESTLELFKQKNSRLRRIYFQGSKVNVKMIVDWFRNLGPNNKISDDDVVKLALILFLEMTLVGKDDRTTILYWALVLVDDLEAFNQFPWGSFIYGRTFNSLSTCLHGRDDKFKMKSTDDKLEENVDGPVRRKGERYNVYGFLTAFQVWAIEAIPKWVTLGYAVRVNNVTPRILNWQCTGTPSYADIQKSIFKFKNITIYRTLGPTDEETRMPYWTGVEKLKSISLDVDGCVGEDDVGEDDVQDEVQDDVDDIDGDHPTKLIKKVEVGGKMKGPVTLEQVVKRLDAMQAQQNAMQAQQKALQDQMTSMHNSIMDEMRMGFLRLTELICLNKVAEKLNEDNTTDFSHDDYIQDYEPSIPHGVKSPEYVVVSETSGDVKELTRPPKLTIRVPRDRKRSAVTKTPFVDPMVKRPRKPKLPEFGSDSKVDDEIVRSMQAWISDNKNTCMDTGLLEAKPAWFERLLSPEGWLEGDIKIEGRWATATATKGKKQKQFNHETYQWDNTMTDYVTGKYSWITSEHWQTVNTILFPANVNKNHWVAVEVDLNERVIKIYDSKPDAYSVDQILKWATCLRKMFPSLLVHVMPKIYTDPSSFTVERPVEGIPHQGNQSDCGVFTLKFLEYLWAKKQFDFDEKDGESFRVKIATEIFQNSKEVPYVNDE